MITFGIKVMPFDRQKALIDDIRSKIDPPGTATSPRPGSAPRCRASGARRRRQLVAVRQPLLVTIAASLAVALVLCAIYRSAAGRSCR